jgi:hypothetical protein
VVRVENKMLEDWDVVVTVENHKMQEDSDVVVTRWRIIRCNRTQT